MIIIGLLIFSVGLFIGFKSMDSNNNKWSRKATIICSIGGVMIIFSMFAAYCIKPNISVERSNIPINPKEVRVIYEVNSLDVYLQDGYGNTYVLPHKDVKITFPNGEINAYISKVTEKTTNSKIEIILLDFGLVFRECEDVTEYYEVCIQKSKVDVVAYARPISDATLEPTEIPFALED